LRRSCGRRRVTRWVRSTFHGCLPVCPSELLSASYSTLAIRLPISLPFPSNPLTFPARFLPAHKIHCCSLYHRSLYLPLLTCRPILTDETPVRTQIRPQETRAKQRHDLHLRPHLGRHPHQERRYTHRDRPGASAHDEPEPLVCRRGRADQVDESGDIVAKREMRGG
jgi:hypothetical protein